LQLRGIGSKGPASKLQTVHIGIAGCPFTPVAVGKLMPMSAPGDGRSIIQFVADDVDAKTEFVDQVIAEDVSFRDAAEAAVQRDIQRKVQIVGAG